MGFNLFEMQLFGALIRGRGTYNEILCASSTTVNLGSKQRKEKNLDIMLMHLCQVPTRVDNVTA